MKPSERAAVRAAAKLSEYCFYRISRGLPCKDCAFWESFPFGQCGVAGKPFAWPTSRYTERVRK